VSLDQTAHFDQRPAISSQAFVHHNSIKALVMEAARIMCSNAARLHWPQLQHIQCSSYIHNSFLVHMWPGCLAVHRPWMLAAPEGMALILGCDSAAQQAVQLQHVGGSDALRVLVRCWHIIHLLQLLGNHIRRLELDVWYDGADATTGMSDPAQLS
jgi:hypothetical protein